MSLWNNVKKEYVIRAIQDFERFNQNHPKPKNTFLLYNGKRYPAKYIRGLAFKIANGKEIKKSEYSGGQETANFFRKLGFEVEYQKSHIKKVIQPTKKKPSVKCLSAVEQKNALQKILQKSFGIIETEKKFEWLKTPNPEQLPPEYKRIVEALICYRNHKTFLKANYPLPCDIVIEQHKIIVEYDENQHFSQARKITLGNYPESVKTYFSKTDWIEQCNKSNAKDNHPIDRDEKRAYYDAVRDIEAFKNGYKLIRIKHGDFDWESENAIDHLKETIPSDSGKHKIVRLILSKKQYSIDKNLSYIRLKPIIPELRNVLSTFVKKVYPHMKFEFIVTPGGFLIFEWPYQFMSKPIDINFANDDKNLQIFYNEADKKIKEFFNNVDNEIYDKLRETADYFTIGIDSENPINHQHIELIAIYDLKNSKIIRWTGKFYPTEGQKNDHIRIKNLESHFIKLNDQNVLILGCHDLKIFSPRGQAVANPNGWKKKTADEFKKLCYNFQPLIIIQHPHETDSPKIWNLEWKEILKKLSCVEHYASGIRYSNGEYEPRGYLKDVLEETKKGDVIDFDFT